MATPYVIRYELTLPGDALVAFQVELDPTTLLNVGPTPASPPEWTRLGAQQCPNCPLQDDDVPHCPVALHLSDVVGRFARTFSFDRVDARVTVPERTYERRDVPVQVALSSLVGVLMPTSGCPVLAALRPMARFHLPFATELETITRSISMYLLRQYFVRERGGAPDWELVGLPAIYRGTGAVNRAFALRLRAAAPKDANVNALMRLDAFARALPDTVESHLEELGFLFETH